MKRYFESAMMLLFVGLAFMACKEEAGTEPGGDGTPVATLYQYASSGDYNPDNDCFIRVSANSATESAYYLAELTSEKEARGLSKEQYADYVVSNGTKMSGISGVSEQDVYITGLKGLYTVSVVAVNGSTKTIQQTEFAGLDYKPFGVGIYESEFFGEAWEVEIEYSEIGNRYRIVNCWYDGYGFAFSPSGKSVTVYPSKTETGYEHSKYGMVSVTDTGSTYDPDSKTFTFAFKWTVSAGSFGVYNDYLTLPE
jgi:hypothetical protein